MFSVALVVAEITFYLPSRCPLTRDFRTWKSDVDFSSFFSLSFYDEAEAAERATISCWLSADSFSPRLAEFSLGPVASIRVRFSSRWKILPLIFLLASDASFLVTLANVAISRGRRRGASSLLCLPLLISPLARAHVEEAKGYVG